MPARTAVTATPATAWTYTFVPDPTHAYSKTSTFEATGTYDEHTFTTTSDRTWVFRMSCPAQEVFIVTLKDDHGDVIDVLADESGVYAGTESVWLKAGSYRIDVFQSIHSMIVNYCNNLLIAFYKSGHYSVNILYTTKDFPYNHLIENIQSQLRSRSKTVSGSTRHYQEFFNQTFFENFQADLD